MFKRILSFLLLFSMIISSNVFAQYQDYDTSYIEHGYYTATLSDMAARRLYVYNILDSENVKDYSTKNLGDYQYEIIYFDNNEKVTYNDVIKLFYRLMKFNDFSSEGIFSLINNFNISSLDEKITEEKFAEILCIWLGYTDNLQEKAKELGLFDCIGKSKDFNKGNAYLMISRALDCPLKNGNYIERDTTNFRKEIIVPQQINIKVSGYEDAIKQVNKCLEYCTERINIKFTEEVSEDTKKRIYEYFCFQEYCWDEGIEAFYPYAGRFDYSRGSNLIISHKDMGFRVSQDSSILEKYPEHQKKYAKIEEMEDNKQISKSEAFFQKSMILYDVCDDKSFLTIYARGQYEHKYLNMDIKNDWITAYKNQEYIDRLSKFAYENLDSLKNLSDYEKIKEIQDIICRNCNYNYTEERRLTYGTVNEDNDRCNRSHDISGFFLYKTIVCDGYAYVFSWMADYLNIDSVIVIGGVTYSDRVGHAWNKVEIENKWYNIDVCWADTGSGSYAYFLKSDKYFQQHQHVFEKKEYLPAFENYRM